MVLGFFEEKKSFDFIIVGGGTAGNTVAGRLAENPDLSILVIEAGPDNPLQEEKISTPALAFQLVETKYDWQYPATLYENEKYGKRFEAKNTRGKVLGGSSCLNYYTWLRGSRGTYDEWQEYGGEAWSWDNCFKYFQKCATLNDKKQILDHDPVNVGATGPLQIHPAIPIPLAEQIQKAWSSQGHPLNDDIYNGEVNGLAHLIHTINEGRRVPSTAFLEGHKNITVKCNTMAHRLLFEGETCVGVACHPTDPNQQYFAKHEVIVSGGVFESPKLLMLSGIGPQNEFGDLTALSSGIGKRIHSPHVGQNLQDHPVCPHSFKLKDGTSLDDVLRPGPKHLEAMAEYKLTKTGPLCSSLLEMSGFARVDGQFQKCKEWRDEKEKRGHDPMGPRGQPHFEYDFLPCFASPFLPHVDEPQEGSYATVVVSLLRPLSRGSLTLRSANALDYPEIKLNYLDHPLDVVALREGVRFVDEILLRGDGMKDLIIDEYPRKVPRENDEEMEGWVHERVSSGYHPCGTCRIGKNIDHGVVDSHLQVYGVRNLRVIDASVIPLIPDARIQNPTYMIAEKGADFIKADHPALYKGIGETATDGLKSKLGGLMANGMAYAGTGNTTVRDGVDKIQRGLGDLVMGTGETDNKLMGTVMTRKDPK